MPLIKPSKRSTRKVNWLFWGVFAFVGLAYAYYFLVYIEDNERFLNLRSSHELQLFMQGVESRDHFFQTVAESNVKTNCHYLDKSFTTKFYCPSELEISTTDERKGIDFDTIQNEYLYNYHAVFDKNLDNSKTISFYVSANDFFDSLARERTFFDRYLVLDSTEVFYTDSYFQISDPKSILDSLSNVGGYEVKTADFSFRQRDYKTFVSSFNLRGHNYHVIGFKDKTEWLALKRAVDPRLSIGFLIGVILLIILIPHIKINNLSYSERLSHKDIFRVSTSLFLVIAFITITAYFVLSFLQIRFKSHEQLSDGLSLVVDSLTSAVDKYDNLLHNDSISALPGVNELFWATPHGLVQEIDVWQGSADYEVISLAEKEHIGNSLGHRDYIKRSGAESLPTNKVHLEFVKSITSSNTEMVMAQRVSSDLVGKTCDYINVVTSIPSALKKTEVADRFFYQIIDREGKIYFDSRPVSGSGSLIDYTFEDESIQGFLSSGKTKSKVMSVFFEDRESFIILEKVNFSKNNDLIEPVSDYYVCVLYDFEQANRFLAASSIVTFLANITLFVILIAIAWLVRKAYHKKSSLAKKRFGFPWLLPSPSKDLEYYYLSLIFCVLIAIQLVVLFLHEELTFSEVLIFQISMVLVSCFSNYFVLTKSTIIKEKKPTWQFASIVALTLLFTTLVFLSIKMNIALVIAFYASFGIVLYALVTKENLISKLKKSDVFASRRLSVYGFFISAWVLAAAFLPSINFSYTSGAYEKSLADWIHIDQERQEEISTDLIYNAFRAEILADLGDSKLIFDIDWSADRLDSATASAVIDDSTKVRVKSEGMEVNNVEKKSAILAPLILEAGESEFDHSYVLAIVLILVIVPGMWYYIHVIRIRLFFHKYDYPKNIEKLSKEVDTLHSYLEKRSNCILLGLPFSGKSQILEALVNKYDNGDVLEFDMMAIESQNESEAGATESSGTGSNNVFSITGKPKLIIVKQLGYMIENENVSKVKLALLSEIKRHRYACKRDEKPVVLITSNVDLGYILNKYDTEIERREDTRELELDRDLWKSILYDFYVLTTALKEEPFSVDDEDKRLELFLKNELYHGRYLKGLYNRLYKESLADYKDDFNQNIRENLVLRIQEIATPYYMSIWKYCSKEDRLVLYDSAEDGYLNSSNRAVINRLLKSGLLVQGERGPRLMNESFGNFILSMANSDEALKLELEANRSGRWSSYRMITILVIISLLMFLTLAEQHMVDKAIAILTAVIALVPAIINGAKNFLFSKSPA